MPVKSETFNSDLYNLLKTKGYDPVSKDTRDKTVPVPQQADLFRFNFKDGAEEGTVWASIDNARNLKIYYDDEVTQVDEAEHDTDDSWYGLIKHLKRWAQNKQLGFELVNRDHLASDMAQREHMKKENLGEGYHPMGKRASYNDNIPEVKIVLQHTRQIEEGEQRYRNVAKIYLENVHGERFLAPTLRPGIAQVYARHLAEGGVPNDERWNHIKSLCEEYSKMAGFVRAVRGNQFNESAMRLVEAGLNHYTGLRETLSRMRGHRGYNTYFESWTPTLMETEGDEPTNLNELFVEETLDPRIESVMPILSRLSKVVSEMAEVKELDEWAKSVLEVEDETTKTMAVPADKMLDEAPGAETLKHNQDTEKSNLKAFGLAEEEPLDSVKRGMAAQAKINKPAYMRKQSGEGPVTMQDLELQRLAYLSGREGLKAAQDELQQKGVLEDDLEEEISVKYEVVDKDGKRVGTWDGMVFVPYDKSKFKAGKMDQIPFGAKVDRESGPVDHARKAMGKVGLEGVAEGLQDDNSIWNQYGHYTKQDLMKEFPNITPQDAQSIVNYAEYGWSSHTDAQKFRDEVVKRIKMVMGQQGVAEGEFAGDYEIGEPAQWRNKGPKANKPAKVGDLVGANESVELSEMDKSQPSSDRGGESSGDPHAKGGKATPAKAKDAEKDAEEALNKSMDKAHKKDVKEGQDDLDAILRIIRK